ncbi:MAG TPA: helix-hairpin-helix domain-containing protein [Anaerolineae bacterium]|nr:helix-hairpin-helix domain-containing protein [Anaerolineae bacterium]HQH39273.1 helix-hairpin-helix domain-containing protein [Anaerolineae bacterium]
METKTLVNLNTAAQDELIRVPGIGPVLAERIVAARPFMALDEVRRVSGIGPSTLGKIAPYLTVEASPLVEAKTPAVLETGPATGSLFTAETPDESHVTEIPADLIPLPPLPVASPWDEGTTPVIVAESAAPPPLLETVMPSPAEEIVFSLPETPLPVPEVVSVASPLPEAPAPAGVAAPQPTPQPERAPTSSKPVTRGQLAWVSFIVFVVTLISALALSLGILAGINGGLNYASPREVERLSQEMTALQGQAGAWEQTLNSVQTRLNNLEALGERVETLETATGDIQGELNTLTAQAKTLSTQVQDLNKATATLGTQVEEVRTTSGQLQKVLEGLRDLLNSLFPGQ